MPFFQKFSQTPNSENGEDDFLSIIENLNNILNTKRGYGAFLSDLGIRDLSEHTSRDNLLPAVIDEVKKNIERYEPRVMIIDITSMEDVNPFRLSFKMECVVLKSKRSLRMVFDSMFHNIKIYDS